MENNQHGGVDTFCSTLLNAWPEPSDSFVFVCNASHPGREEVRAAVKRPCEFIKHRIPLSWVLSRQLFGWLPTPQRRVSQPFLRILLYPMQHYALRRLFRRIDGDALLVINGGFPGGESCRIANIAWSGLDGDKKRTRNIHNFHNFAVAPRRGFGWYENRLDRRLAAAAGRLISVSRSCSESLRVRESFRDSTAICHIYNGIEPGEGDRGGELPDLRRELGIGDAPFCLILANYETRKGHRFLFEAFAKVAKRIPEAHLVACGGGTEEEVAEVEALRERLAPDAKIHLLGFVPGGPALIEQADLVVISSQCFESFGLTAVEAMIRGVPVVATRVGGLPEVVGEAGEGGYIVAADDPEAFAARIVELLADPERRRAMGERGRERANARFTAQRMAKEYHDALHAEPSPLAGGTEAAPRGEWHYLARRLVEPAMALGVAGIVWSALARRLGNRLVRDRRRHYPPAIRALADVVETPSGELGLESPGELSSGPRRLKLAVGHLPFDGWPRWESAFDDHEQFVSLHRWNWLLRALTDESPPADFPWGVALMRSWLAAMSPLPPGDASESYTVGERIANACLFTRHTRGEWDGLPADLLDALGRMAADLANRIEYHAGELSGNHVLNNARALLFAGHCVREARLVALARALIDERLPRLVSEGRFLREGSSHYQFLFTRWLLEVRLLAEEFDDEATLKLLRPVLPSLVEGCRFFLVEGAGGEPLLPTIGDISPDCEPAWLIDLPDSPLARFGESRDEAHRESRGWAGLFPRALSDSPMRWVRPEPPSGGWRAHPRAGWYRLDEHGWVAIWRAESSSGEAIASHAHHDSGALVLFHRGREVLIDPGRRDYTGAVMGRYGASGEAHNTVLVDDRQPMLSRGDRLLPESYREAECGVECRVDGEAMTVSFEHDGFERLALGITSHRREFRFSPRELVISDFFEGRGVHRVEGRFHCPNLESGVELAVLESPGKFHARTLKGSRAPIGGWRFPAYGVEAPAVTRLFRGEFEFPVLLRYRLSVEED
jgi:glycosyltransferase involved in cell wall biosynthesis